MTEYDDVSFLNVLKLDGRYNVRIDIIEHDMKAFGSESRALLGRVSCALRGLSRHSIKEYGKFAIPIVQDAFIDVLVQELDTDDVPTRRLGVEKFLVDIETKLCPPQIT